MANEPQPKTRVGQIISDIRANRAENLKAKSEKLKAKAEVIKARNEGKATKIAARAEGKAAKIAARAEAKKVNRDYPLSTTPEPKVIVIPEKISYGR